MMSVSVQTLQSWTKNLRVCCHGQQHAWRGQRRQNLKWRCGGTSGARCCLAIKEAYLPREDNTQTASAKLAKLAAPRGNVARSTRKTEQRTAYEATMLSLKFPPPLHCPTSGHWKRRTHTLLKFFGARKKTRIGAPTCTQPTSIRYIYSTNIMEYKLRKSCTTLHVLCTKSEGTGWEITKQPTILCFTQKKYFPTFKRAEALHVVRDQTQ